MGSGGDISFFYIYPRPRNYIAVLFFLNIISRYYGAFTLIYDVVINGPGSHQHAGSGGDRPQNEENPPSYPQYSGNNKKLTPKLIEHQIMR